MLESLSITKLYQVGDIDLKFNKDISILYGDNGSYKSTCFNIIDLISKGEFRELRKFNFEELKLVYISKNIYNCTIVISMFKLKMNVFFEIRNIDDESIIIDSYKLSIEESFKDNEIISKLLANVQENIYKSSDTNRTLIRDIYKKYPISIYYLPVDRYDFFNKGFGDEVTHYTKVNKLIASNYLEVKEEENKQNELFKSKIFEEIFSNSHKNTKFLYIELTPKDNIINLKKYLQSLNLNSEVINKNIDNFLSKYSKASKYFDVVSKIPNEERFSHILADMKDNQNGKKNVEGFKEYFDLQSMYSQLSIINSLVVRLKESEKFINEKKEKLNIFKKTLNLFFNYTDTVKFDISEEEGLTYSRTFRNGDFKKNIDIRELSSGETQILMILAYSILQSSEALSTIIIDEPELSMHPSWQVDFLYELNLAIPNLQIICATHSPQISLKIPEKILYSSLKE